MTLRERTPQDSTVARRVLIVGAPGSMKTTSLLTWPKPLHILSYPGEKGWETIPTNLEGVKAYVWDVDDP
ncbi:MAG: hypothetical protein AABY22_05715, partial [Nanoarchaeota archaeon]